MVELNLFHYQERNTWLHRRHPLAKLSVVLGCSLVLVQPTLPASLLLLALVSAAAWSIRLPVVRYTRELRFFLFMAAVMASVRIASGQPASTIVASSAAFLATVVLGAVFVDTTSSDDLARGIGGALSHIPGVPGYRVGAAMELALLSIPLVIDTVNQVARARSARMEHGYSHPVRRIASFGAASFELLLEQSQTLTTALDARLFNPDQVRTPLRFTRKDFLLMIPALCAFLM